MTEEEWLTGTDPTPLIGYFRSTASDRKLRLLTVACCRRIWDMFEDMRSRKAIEIAELFADNFVTETDLDAALTLAFHANYDATGVEGTSPNTLATCDFTGAVKALTQPPSRTMPETGRYVQYDGWDALVMIARGIGILNPDGNVERRPYPAEDLLFEDGTIATESVSLAEQTAQAALVRDIFGNPFRPVQFDPAWRTSTAVGVAEAIYADRTFGDLPVLADALQDAGCDHADILTHLRGPGPHVRGCWALDLVLGKE